MSAARALGDAIVERLAADGAVQAALGGSPADPRIYNTLAPAGSLSAYITLGESVERYGGPAAAFNVDEATDGTERLHLWTAGPDKRPALLLYEVVAASLRAGPALTLDGGRTLLHLTVRLERTVLEPDGAYHRAIALVAARTRGAA